MKKETEFFVSIPLNSIDIFNQRNNFVSLSEHWIDYRIKLFLDYTLMSLKSQTDQDFLAILHVHESSLDYVRSVCSREVILPDNLLISDEGDAIFADRIVDSSKILKLRLDSDNVIHPTYVENARKMAGSSSANIFIGRYGYMYDRLSQRIAEWNHDSSAFNTYVFSPSEYVALRPLASDIPEQHMLAKQGNFAPLYASSPSGRSFLFVVHDQNLQNNFDALVATEFAGRVWSTSSEVEAILSDFGVLG